MRYFDDQLVANSRPHAAMWNEVSLKREWFHQTEDAFAAVQNASAILPRDAWLELDGITRRVMRTDEGSAYMNDLMPLAKAVDIGVLVSMNRVSSDVGAPVIRSMSGQVPVALDKVSYAYRGVPVPIFADGYKREWREWRTLQNANFDALADDQEATTAKIKRDMALFALNGDATIVVQGYQAYGIRTNPLSKMINLGPSGGGANIDLDASATTSDAIEAFFNGPFGALLDANLISQKVNIYVSPEIMRNLDRPYSGAAGFKVGSLREALESGRRINKIVQTFELTGNQFFGFVPSADYIRPLVGMAVNTTAGARLNPTDNYQFLVMGAMGLEIRADYNNRSGVFYSTDT